MSWLSRIFGGGQSVEPELTVVDYKGFSIEANPMRDGSKFRIAAKVSKDVDGEKREHQLIRADTLDGYDAAVDASVNKAKQMIDEQGDRFLR